MGAYCHTTVGCACALRAHPPPTTARASRLASIAGFAYNLCLCPTGPPTLKKIKKKKKPRAGDTGSGVVVNCPLVQTTFDQIYNPILHRELEFRHHRTNPYKHMLFGRMFFYQSDRLCNI